MEASIQSALDELQTKVSGLDKIAEIETAVVDDQRELAKTRKEFSEATERVEASIEKLPEQWRNDIREHLNTLPDPAREKGQPVEEWIDMSRLSQDDFVKFGDPENRTSLASRPEGTAFRKSFLSPCERAVERQKTISATTGVGAGTVPAILWNEAIVGDPWVRAGAFQTNPSAPNFQTLEVSNVQFAESTTTTAASFDNPVGTLGSASPHTVKTYACRIIVPNEQEADLMGTLAHVEMMMLRAYGKLRGSTTTTAVAGGTKGGNKVATGTASTALTNTNAVNKLLQLTTMGSVADYMGHAFVLHPDDKRKLYENLTTSSGINIDPASGIMRLMEYPIVDDNQAEAVGTTGKKPDFFGAWGDAVIQAQRGRLVMDRYMATVPGAVALYATFRFLPVVVNNEAYSFIQVGT